MEKFKIEVLREKLNKELEKDSPDKGLVLAISQDLDKLIVKYTKVYINGLDQEFSKKNRPHNIFEEEECILDWDYWFFHRILV